VQGGASQTVSLPPPWVPPGAGILLLDGATGTALRALGLPPAAFPEEWLFGRPAAIASVHASHVRAGAGMVLTCTFNAARLDGRGLEPATEALCARAVTLARQAGAPRVAGCVGSTGLVREGGGPPDGELFERFARPFRALAAAGADLAWTETHASLREARAALAAARAAGLNAVATMFLGDRDGVLASAEGMPGEECLAALWREGAAAVGVNCSPPGPPLAALVARSAARVGVPLVVKPSAGPPGSLLSPEAFAARIWPSLAAGARACGGCCGAGPDHLRALALALARR